MPLPSYKSNGPISDVSGVGLKPQHYREILERTPKIGWFEVHTENYMGAGGAPHHYLERIRQDYPLSLHGVGLSLGTAKGLDKDHLKAIKGVVDRYQPGLISEHISWSVADGVYLNDLIPVPYTAETLTILCDHIDQVQNYLGRQILVENPSSYLLFEHNSMDEVDFLNGIISRSGCGLLLDVNNVYVSCVNHGWDARQYISRLDPKTIGEIHLAGHSTKHYRGKTFLIDDHGSNVCNEVWELFDFTLSRMGQKPTLIEWDNNIPSLMTLEQEADRAALYLEAYKARPSLQNITIQDKQDETVISITK